MNCRITLPCTPPVEGGEVKAEINPACHAGLDPAFSKKNFGKTALDSLRGEFIEPRVKPGMTFQCIRRSLNA